MAQRKQDGGPALEEYRRKRNFRRVGWVEPELTTLTHDRFFDPDWLYERKFDGERCLATRRGARVREVAR